MVSLSIVQTEWVPSNFYAVATRACLHDLIERKKDKFIYERFLLYIFSRLIIALDTDGTVNQCVGNSQGSLVNTIKKYLYHNLFARS